MGYILYFLAAVLVTNGLPHFIKGLMGECHVTPFKKPSSAVANVLWGLANIFVGFWLAAWASSSDVSLVTASFLVLFGSALAGIRLATWWQEDPQARGKK